MHIAQGEITFGNRLDDNADGENVEDVLETATAGNHLVVNAVDVLGAALYGAVEIFERHLDLKRANHGLHVVLALFLVLDKSIDELLVFIRVYVLETQIFKFGF